MDRFTVYKTDKGRYAVRPIDWAGIWDNDWNIKENGINHTAIFEEKEDAEFFARTKSAEEQGKLLILPCKPGDTVYYIYMDCPEDYIKEYCTDHEGSCEKCPHRVGKILSKKYVVQENVCRPVYLTKPEAEKALEDIKNE